MKNPVQLTEVIDPIQNSLRPSPWRCRALIISLAFGIACFTISPTARAVDPPPDGGYPNDNTAEGEDALFSLDTSNQFASGNTAIGYHALFNTRDAANNTAIGGDALASNISGVANVAVGAGALYSNVDGWDSTAIGYAALELNTVGGNTAIGSEALESNITGGANTAVGTSALALSTGDNNTATGYAALAGDFLTQGSSGSFNTADGAGALQSYTTGSNNTATGYLALYSLSTGSYNTANGVQALYSNTIGIDNTANGNYSLYNNTTGVNNTADGLNALYYNTTGSNNIALGFSAGVNLTTGDNNIDIGHYGVAGESAKIRIGTKPTHKNTYIAGIYGVTVSRGIGVIIDSTGHLGTTTSSARYKDNIKPMDKASEAILALQPVTFRYKQELDPDQIPQFGLVAEQVAKVNPDLVAFDGEGIPYTVRYEAVNAMLLNEFLKAHKKGEEQGRKIAEQNRHGQEQDATIGQLKSAIAQQQKEIEALTAGLKKQAAQVQKVSDQLELSKAASRMVLNND